MANVQFKISTKAIRRANNNLISKGITNEIKDNYNGVITAKTVLNGVVRVRTISKEEINNAYEKALKEYAEKL